VCATSFIQSQEGFYTTSSSVNAIQAPLGGFFGKTLILSKNASSLQTTPADTMLQLGNADGTNVRIIMDGYAAAGNFTFRRSSGTAASPSAISAADAIGSIAFFGYGTSAYTTSARGRFNGYAAENWTNSANGTLLTFETTPNGSTSIAERMRIDQSGHVYINATTDDSSGAFLQVAGFVSATTGFYSVSASSTAIQAPAGGVTALVLTSVRNDGDSGLILSRNSSTARNWGLNVGSDGFLYVRDRTGSANVAVFTSGAHLLIGTATDDSTGAKLQISGFVSATTGYYSAGTNYDTFKSAGGMYAINGFTSDQAFYPKSFASATMNAPAAGYSGLAHKSGSNFWYYNSGWQTVDFASIGGGGSVAGSDTQVQYNNSGSFGASANFTFASQVLTVTAASSGVAGIVCGTGFIQAATGFYSPGVASTTVNIPSGGVTALSLVSIRNDGLSGVSIARTTSTAHTYGLAVDSSGRLNVNDDTGSATRLLLDTSGRLAIGGYISGRTEAFQLAFADATMSIQATSSSAYSGVNMFDSAGTLSASFQYGNSASSFPGNFFIAARTATGIITLNTNGLTEQLRVKADGQILITSGQVTMNPVASAISATNGAIYYDSGAHLFQFRQNGSWVGLASAGVTSLSAGTGVSVSASTGAVTVSIGQAVGTSSAVSFSSVTTSGVVQSTATGGSICFQGNGGTFQVNGTGDCSGGGVANFTGGYKVGGTVVFDSSRNMTNIGTISNTGLVNVSSGNVNVDTSHCFAVGGLYFGQDATGGLVCGSHALFFKGGILYAFT
jgi:hypothetical protein